MGRMIAGSGLVVEEGEAISEGEKKFAANRVQVQKQFGFVEILLVLRDRSEEHTSELQSPQ